MLRDHSGSNALQMIKANFARPANLLRIATGYFSFEGWRLLQSFLECQEIRILIGFDENAGEILKDKIVKQIMLDLSKWHSDERREAIKAIVERMKVGGFYFVKNDYAEELQLRTKRKDHTKVYILDEDIVLAGSANLSKAGLTTNLENLTAIIEQERFAVYIKGFEEGWASENSVDITQELLERLSEWLKMVNPFDIYLKTVDTLAPPPDEFNIKPSYKKPNEYQMDVINQMERQLEDYKGCILIASTGLGKTIMATHTAVRMYHKRMINSILVFAPKATHKDWENTVKSSGIIPQIFTRNLLDNSISNRKFGQKFDDMLIALDDVDDKTIIIIDEAQYLANRNRQPRAGKTKKYLTGERESHKRIKDAVHKKGAYIILMTATPFVKRPSDVNNQLSLLPHTGKTTVTRKRDFQLSYLEDVDNVTNDWHVTEGDHFFQEFSESPISNLITTAYVAKKYCSRTEEGEYLDFPDKRRYLPRVEHSIIRVPVPFEKEMDDILINSILEHKVHHFKDRDFRPIRSKNSEHLRALIACASSPEALKRLLERVISVNSDDKIKFNLPLEQRKAKLEPILKKIAKHKVTEDIKFIALLKLLEAAKNQDRKAIVFVEALSTAFYLEKNLRKHLKSAKVESTVQHDDKNDRYKTKAKSEVQKIFNNFAPTSNADKIHNSNPITPIDILVTTDAFSAGINLQDASIVINYDLAWTFDIIIQRAGRIMRFWDVPRTVNLYTFLPNATTDTVGETIRKIMQRNEKLFERANTAVKFSEFQFLLDESTTNSFGDLSQITIEKSDIISTDTIESRIEVSPMLDRRFELRQHKDRAKALQDDLVSALEKPTVTRSQLYMLVRVEKRALLILYDVENKKLINQTEQEILDLIHCTPQEPPAMVDPGTIDREALECLELWCTERDVEIEKVERVATLLIVPKDTASLYGGS